MDFGHLKMRKKVRETNNQIIIFQREKDSFALPLQYKALNTVTLLILMCKNLLLPKKEVLRKFEFLKNSLLKMFSLSYFQEFLSECEELLQILKNF